MARVAVLAGGHSMEREISIVTGTRVRRALERLGHEVHELDLDENTTEALIESRPDAAFVCLHGIGGEDGTVQTVLETLGIPYTGSGPLSSTRSMDKDYAKRMMLAGNVVTPPFRTFLRRAMREMGAASALREAAESIGYPLFVKPARGGSGMGISTVESEDDLLDAVYEALGYDAKIILEKLVYGTEVTVPVIEPHGEPPRALGLVEIRPQGGTYDYGARYTPGMTDFAIPAEVPSAAAVKIEEAALDAYRTLGCSGFARVDLILSGDTPWVIEVNSIPGFTETSTLPLAAEAAGLPFDDLVETILESALRTEAAAKL
jgi:D-alanine-D-alanine ligase